MVASLTELAPQPRTAAVPLNPYQDLSRCLSFDLEVSVEDGSLLASPALGLWNSLSMSGRVNPSGLQRLEWAITPLDWQK